MSDLAPSRHLRLGFITHEPVPSRSASSTQLLATAAALARAGSDVTLIVPVAWSERRRPTEEWRAIIREHYGLEAPLRVMGLPFAGLRSSVTNCAHGCFAVSVAAGQHFDALITRDALSVARAICAGIPTCVEAYRPPAAAPAPIRGILRLSRARRALLLIVAHSDYVRRGFLEAGYPAAKVVTVRNGIDGALLAETPMAPAAARRALGLPERPTIVYAGKLVAAKRVDLLVRAARQMPECSWVFAGEESRGWSGREGPLPPNAVRTGYLRGPKLALALWAADLLVIPPSAEPLGPSGRTGLPLKLFQYLPAGRAIVAGDLPDVREILCDGQTGMLVPPDDDVAFAGAVRLLLADDALRQRLGTAARELARTLTWERRAERLLAEVSRGLEA